MKSIYLTAGNDDPLINLDDFDTITSNGLGNAHKQITVKTKDGPAVSGVPTKIETDVWRDFFSSERRVTLGFEWILVADYAEDQDISIMLLDSAKYVLQKL